jgi:hypothetical protein
MSALSVSWQDEEVTQAPGESIQGWLSRLEDSWQRGSLTTEHAASSRGLPVVVDASGTARGTAEVGELHVYSEEEADGYRHPLTAGQRELVDAAVRAGYRVHVTEGPGR